MSTVLRGMQSLLGSLYDVEVQYDVSDFLVTDRSALGGITRDNDTRILDEELLVAESADGAGVALYLDPSLLQRLERADPLGALTEHNLADYCTALEGVSHFVYTTWRVHPRLFDRVSFDARLEPDQYHRYRTAHRCAAQYCRRLERRFVQRGEARIEALLRELRKFYRLGAAAKLRHALA